MAIGRHKSSEMTLRYAEAAKSGQCKQESQPDRLIINPHRNEES